MGIGCTHAPHLQFTNEHMANVFMRTLARDRTPEELRDPANWPPGPTCRPTSSTPTELWAPGSRA